MIPQFIVTYATLLLFSFLVPCQLFAQTQPRIIPPDHPHIRYMGRWVVADHTARAEWQGSSFAVWTQSSSLKATLDGGSETEYFRIVINDDVSLTKKISIRPGKFTYQIADGLPSGIHKIEVIKETYAGQNTTFFGLALEGDASLLPPPAPSERFLSFYGDSNLAGYSLESEHNESDQALRGSFFGLAGITARMFDATYHNISISGASISSLHAAFDQSSRWNPSSTVNVASYNPDAVIVNLGANDVGKPKEDIKQDYHRFLDTLRTIHPETHIVLFNAWGWDYNEPANYTHEVVAERDDPNLSVATFPWVFETWHGCEYDHAGMAAVLTKHLSKILDWTPKASDVMSGYGENGNVANGGFEKIAPFGGYGWRYFRIDGVGRIDDPEHAFEGSYYISLSNEAAIHQPNPAKAGDEITVQLWMKGSSSEDHAKIKLDFRDQKMWTTPLKSDSLIIKLTPDWARYEIKAQAPVNSDRPVFHTRMTVGAEGVQSRVNVDAITMSINSQ